MQAASLPSARLVVACALVAITLLSRPAAAQSLPSVTGISGTVERLEPKGAVGPLSNVECAEPVPVEDFWKRYDGAGGQGGGGFCSTESAGAPAGTTGLGLLTVASVAAIARRRRRA